VFVWDDDRAIVENASLRSLRPLSRAMSAPVDTTLAGRPVASLSFAINYAIAPGDARDVMRPDRSPGNTQLYLRNLWGYHAANLATHLLAGLLLFGIVRRALQSPRLPDGWEARSTPFATVVAVLWMVHPVNTQAVTYVVQRVESLMGMFYLLTLYCAIRAAANGPWRRAWSAGAIAACALGMGTKEVLVTAPIMVVLWDASFAPAGTVRRRWPLYAGLASTWAVLLALVATPARQHSVGVGLGGWTSWLYLQTQAAVIVHYLRLAVAAADPVFDYRWAPERSFVAVAPQFLGLAALLGTTVLAFVKRWPAGFLGAWFFLILAPTSSVLPIATEAAADHRMYLPLAAVIVVVVVAIVIAGERLAAFGAAPASGRRGIGFMGLALAGITAVALGHSTRERNRDYWSVEALMRDTIAKRPANAPARLALGAALVGDGRFADAEDGLRTLLTLDTETGVRAHAHMFLGTALCATGRVPGGVEELKRALTLDPTLTDAHALLGEAYDGLGQPAEAVAQFDLAVHGTPDNPILLRRVAWFLATTSADNIRDGRRAIALAERAQRLTRGDDAGVMEALGAAYAELDRFEDAARALETAEAIASTRGDAAWVLALRDELATVRAHRKIRVGER